MSRFGVQAGFAIAVAAGRLIVVAALSGYRRLSGIEAADGVEADFVAGSRASVGACKRQMPTGRHVLPAKALSWRG
ncbi:hypothetical protein [Ensifer canadensis]